MGRAKYLFKAQSAHTGRVFGPLLGVFLLGSFRAAGSEAEATPSPAKPRFESFCVQHSILAEVAKAMTAKLAEEKNLRTVKASNLVVVPTSVKREGTLTTTARLENIYSQCVLLERRKISDDDDA